MYVQLRNHVCLVMVVVLAGAMVGCVRRTLTISTEPVSGARVLLNDEDVGVSPVTVDFTWYGDYEVIIRHPDYQTLNTHWRVRGPWYQVPPIDFFAEVLLPVTLHDRHEQTFTLVEQTTPTRAELVKRADEMRESALFSDE